jgi:aldehyde:ferredoxin oxidoreductase
MMKTKGYMGRLLRIDLTSGKIEAQELDDKTARMVIGGTGLAAKILWEETDAATDPLGPDNLICFFTGPCTGTPVPTSGRLGIASLSPMTGIWGESSLGGSWAVELKRAGYDGLVVSGAADKPVYIFIDDDTVEIRSAEHLWGNDTWVLDTRLKKETHLKASTLGIGIAGENRVRFASIQADGRLGRSASRCGLGAVMGAKCLKGIVVKGTHRIPVYDSEGILGWRRQHFNKKPKDAQQIYKGFRLLGERTWDHMFTSKNWQNVRFESFKEPWIEELAARDLVEKNLFLHCSHCAVGCVESFKDETGKRYQTGQHTAKMGALCMIGDMSTLQECYDICQRSGMDSISLGSALAFAMEAFERGLITLKDTDGINLTWGNSEALLQLTEKTANLDGFGEFISIGVKGMADVLGKEAMPFAVHIKGNDPTLQDFRAWNAGALENATCSRGAHHFEGMTLAIQTMGLDFSQWGDFPTDPLAIEGQGRLTAFAQNFGVMVDSLVVCKFLMGATSTGQINTPAEHALWLNLVTGWEDDFSEFMLTGERIFNLKRMINVRRGITRKDDVLPFRLANEKRGWGGMSEENVPPLDRMIDEYYAVRGWDSEGVPTGDRLAKLGIPLH